VSLAKQTVILLLIDVQRQCTLRQRVLLKDAQLRMVVAWHRVSVKTMAVKCLVVRATCVMPAST